LDDRAKALNSQVLIK